MERFPRIVSKPDVMRGQACVKGTRLPVSSIIGMIAKGHSRERIIEEFPEVTMEDVEEALQYTAWRISEQQASVG